jgi:hypothetical protein
MSTNDTTQAFAGSYSKDPNAELNEALQKNYVGVLFQQGKPILDRELNLLGALANSRRLAQWYIGDGVPTGDDGFRITDLKLADNDFTIKHGRILVNGYEVVLDQDTTYSQQPLAANAAALTFNDGSESIYDVHLRVETQEVSWQQDHDLKNDSDIGFETALREQVIWEVIVSKQGTLHDPNAHDLCLLARVDTRQATPDAQRIIDERTTGVTLASISRAASKTPEDLTLNTLKVRDRVDIGTASPQPQPPPPPPPSTLPTQQTLDAAAKAANASDDAARSIIDLFDAMNKPEVAGFQQSLGFSLDKLKQDAQTAKTAAQTAQAAVAGAANGDPAQVLSAARTASEQANIAAGAAKDAAAMGIATAQGIGQRAAGDPAMIKIADSVKAPSTAAAQSADAAVKAAANADANVNALAAAIMRNSMRADTNQPAAAPDTAIPDTAALVVNGETYTRGNLSVAGAVAADNLSLSKDNDHRGALFLATKGDFNHALYNDITNIDGDGSWDGAKWNTGSGLRVRTGAGASKRIALSIDDQGSIGVRIQEPNATLHVAGGKGDLAATEGDFKIGDDNTRMKVGVDTTAGEVRLRADGGTGGASKLILGSGKSDVLTIQEQVLAMSAISIAMPSPDSTIKAANDAVDAGRSMLIAAKDYLTLYQNNPVVLDLPFGFGSSTQIPNPGMTVAQLQAMTQSFQRASQSVDAAAASAGRAQAKRNNPPDVSPEVAATAKSIQEAVAQCAQIAQTQPMPGMTNMGALQNAQGNLAKSNDLAAQAANAAQAQADQYTKLVQNAEKFAATQASKSEKRSAFLSIKGNVGIGQANPSAFLDIQGGADSNGNNDPRALAFAWHGGGFRHWVRTRHMSPASSTDSVGNAFDFYVNNSSAADGSTAPESGSLHTLTLDSGNVGIRTTSPQATLHIRQSLANRGIILDEADGNGNTTGRSFSIGYEGQGNIHFYHKGSIGQWMGGDGKWNLNSDIALKEQVSLMSHVLDRVMRLKPVNFVWKDSQIPDTGFVAQDVEEVFPEIVRSANRDGTEVKGLPYTSFGVFAIAAIQELKHDYDEKLRALEEKLSRLSQRD